MATKMVFRNGLLVCGPRGPVLYALGGRARGLLSAGRPQPIPASSTMAAREWAKLDAKLGHFQMENSE